MASYDFDRATAVTSAGEGRFVGAVSPDWTIGAGPNGGYMVSIALSALARTLPQPDPFAITAHFVSRAAFSPVEIPVEVVRLGRGLSTGVARLEQEGRTKVHVTATFGDLDTMDGPTIVQGEAPAIEPLEECVPASRRKFSPFTERFDLRLTPDSAAWAKGRPTGVPEVAGWIRFADGREPDAASLAQFADAFPPTAFNLFEGVGWVPTIELTVHVRARPAPGWLRCRFRTRFVTRGYLEEDGEIWDAAGRLVALSRQMARVNVPA